MPVVLFRVDERLIHGQVVVGWGSKLHPDRIVVVDDELARSSWEQELYDVGLPAHLRAEFLDVERAREELDAWEAAPERTVVLTRDLETMRRLAENRRLEDREINIGGIHYAAGRRAALPYVYLGAVERQELQRLLEEGARPIARDLPDSPRVDAGELLRRTGGGR